MEDKRMRFLDKGQLAVQVSFALFIVALLAGLIAYWQVCIVAAITLLLFVALKFRSRRLDEVLADGSN